MPIDTAEKRRSAAHVGRFHGGKGVTPNAAAPVNWRQEVGWSYSGISPNPPAEVTGGQDRLSIGVEDALAVGGFTILGGGGWS